MTQARKSILQLCQALRQRRGELGIDQGDLARLSGVSLHFVSDLETGKGNPTIAKLDRVLNVLGLRIVLSPSAVPGNDTEARGSKTGRTQ